MPLNAFLDTVRDALETRYPGLATCEVHAGHFDIEELGQASFKPPAMKVALAGFEVARDAGGELDLACRLSVVIVTADTTSLKRHMAANALATDLGTWLPGNNFGQANAGAAEKVAAANLYGGKLAGKRLSLWEVTWEQTVRLGASLWPEGGVMPSRLYVGWSPKIGEAHKDDYELVEDEG